MLKIVKGGGSPIDPATKILHFESMPRPKCRCRIEGQPVVSYFKPAGIPLSRLEEVVLAQEEWEALRLADQNGLYRQQAAVRMHISRQTFDRIVRQARTKVAEALIAGKALRLENGDNPCAAKSRRSQSD